MNIELMEITHVRNLLPTKLHFNPHNNLIVGPNGSGKTSLLEAIYLLGRAKSFRTEHAREVIQDNTDELIVFGQIRSDGLNRRIGVRRDRKSQVDIRIDSMKVHASSELARVLPILLVTPDTMELFSGPPSVRRAYLDWVMFHVKPHYQEAWTQYHRALRQRNAALRSHRNEAEIETWDTTLVQLGEQLTEARATVFPHLSTGFTEELAVAGIAADISLDFDTGSSEHGLASDLNSHRERDIALGYTSVGPHRADIQVRTKGRKAKSVLSRGQTKLAVWALMSAALHTKKRLTGVNSIVLIDDVGSELDPINRAWVLNRLAVLDSQTFITTTEAVELSSSMADFSMFHVKHGLVQEVV